MMKRLTVLLSAALVAPLLHAEDVKWGNLTGNPPIHLNPDRSLLRASATMVPDVGPGDDIGLGFEIAAGVPTPACDTLAVYVGHMDADDSDMTTLGLFAEETYKIHLPLMPYVGAGLGYGWVDQTDDIDQSSIIAEVEVGVKFAVCPHALGNVGVEMNWADEEVFPSTDGLEDKQWRFVAGVSWLY